MPKETPVEAKGAEPSQEEPIFLCLDLPTGLCYPEQRDQLHDDLPEQMFQALNRQVLQPVVGALAGWWLEHVVEHCREDERDAMERALIDAHRSDRTSFYLIPQKSNTERTHPLHGMLIALVVFHGCTRLDAQSLEELRQRVLAVHPHGKDEVVCNNFSITGFARLEDCVSLAATLALMVKNSCE